MDKMVLANMQHYQEPKEQCSRAKSQSRVRARYQRYTATDRSYTYIKRFEIDDGAQRNSELLQKVKRKKSWIKIQKIICWVREILKEVRNFYNICESMVKDQTMLWQSGSVCWSWLPKDLVIDAPVRTRGEAQVYSSEN